MSITIRRTTRADAILLPPLYNPHLGKATLDVTPRQSDFFIDMINKLEDREMMLSADKDRELAGYGILKRYSWKMGYFHAGEISLFLGNDFTGFGIGEKLMLELIAQAKKWEYRHLVTRIMASNKGSISFHKKLGYEMVGIQNQIGFAHGAWQDVAVMQLIIS